VLLPPLRLLQLLLPGTAAPGLLAAVLLPLLTTVVRYVAARCGAAAASDLTTSWLMDDHSPDQEWPAAAQHRQTAVASV
jgi:hypothetical protein